MSLSEFIIDAVEKRMLSSEKRELLNFIENQDNIFIKIETNINQFAKVANSQKNIPVMVLESFNNKLEEINKLKEKQNKIFHKIYKELANQ